MRTGLKRASAAVLVVVVAAPAAVLALAAFGEGVRRLPESAPPSAVTPAQQAEEAKEAERAERAVQRQMDEARARADSLLETLPMARLATVPESVLTLVRIYADSSSRPQRFVAVMHELGGRYQRLAKEREREAADQRVASVLAAARASSTMDGERCTRATRERAARLVRSHGAWSDDALATVACGWIQRGMTAEQVTASWGRPTRVNRTVGSYGVHEQWVYGEDGHAYVYVEGGVVSSWQTSR